MRALMRTAALALAVAGLHGPARADAWTVEETASGTTSATVTASAQYGAHAAPVAIRLQCQPGADGTLSILLIVRDPRFVPTFPFDAFEGPDAPANELALLRVEVGGAMVSFAYDLPTSGWYLDRNFIVAHAAPSAGDSPVRRIADAIVRGATALTIGVRVPEDPSKALVALVPLDGAGAAVGRATAGCL